jgi:gliding motility-associated-like protein
MKTRGIFIIIAIFLCITGWAQYLPNPSFEGIFPNPNEPPAPWEKCSGSPDTQPYTWDVSYMPSHGDSYVGFAWLPSWIERIWSDCNTPLSGDTCYLFQIDLASYPEINYYGTLQSCFPMMLQVYRTTNYCTDGALLWESPLITSEGWNTYEFVIEAEGTPTEQFLLRSHYNNTNMPADIGYLLADNIRITPPPPLDLGPDTTICNGESILLNAGSAFEDYEWQDNSTDSTFTVTQPGTYYVEATTSWGCPVVDSIIIEYSVLVNLGNDTSICIGDTMRYNAGAGYSQYEWQDGSSDSTYLVWEPGNYNIWVYVEDEFGCYDSDTVNLTIIDDGTEVSLGNDTLLCYGSEFVLNPGVFDDIQWQDGSINPTFTVTQPGIYWVTVFGECGTGADTIAISYLPEVEVGLGEDVTLCAGEFVTLDAGFGYLSYLWQDGSTTQQLNVYESGLYYVTVENINSCLGGDSVIVEVANVVTLPAEAVICAGETLTINAGFGFDNYNWSNGSDNQIIEVSEGSIYYVDVAYNFGCPSSDTIKVTWTPQPISDLGEDTGICEGSSLELIGPDGDYIYFWNGIQGEQIFEVSEGGTYELKVANSCGEAISDIYIDEYPVPEVNLGEDGLLFPGEELQLDAGEQDTYFWFDGSNGRYYQIYFEDPSDDDLYWVQVSNEHDCKATDSVKIELFNIFVPIVITPNGDLYNNRFEPKEGSWSGIHEHRMTVFNRWGEKVWETNDFESGWDGKQNGRFVAEGTYFWMLEIKYGPNNISKDYKGSLTIMGTN